MRRPPRVLLAALAASACAPAPPAVVPREKTAEKHEESPKAAAAPGPAFAKTSTAKLATLDDHAWPPPGEWTPFERPWLHKIEGAPPTFYRTTTPVDPKRKATVEVVALDARQLEFEMAIGGEGPWPPDEKKNGKFPRFGGKLPRETAVATRVVVAFNGGFRLEQNAWGMMIRRRVFAPPVRDVASLLMHDDGRLGFGTWGPDFQTPEGVRSLRQNLDPLLDDGEIDPRHRKRWGGILKAESQVGQRAKRTGICRTAGGHVLYLYGDAIEAAELGAAMKNVGCEYGLHLDMNVAHVVFMSYDDANYKVGKSEVLSKKMGITEKRYIHQPNPKEFFYATLRTPAVGPAGFAPDGFAQPPPAWMPAIVARSEDDVRITFLDARRTRAALTLAGDDTDRVLAAIDLGPNKNVALDAAGHLQLADAAPIIADGKPLAPPPELSRAVGVTAHGDVVIAERTGGAATPALIIEALLRAGCVRAVAARGFERAGRDEIRAGGAGTRVYLVGVKAPSATYRFDRDEGGALRWPKVTTPLK